MQGEAAAGVAHLRQALASPDVGPESLRSYWLAALAEAYGRAGQPQAGLQVLAEAVTLMATTEMRWWEAEVSRLQGELLLQLPSPDVPQAEAAFLRALDVARRQQAKALELRAALSLSRLWQGQGKRDRGPTAAGPDLRLVHRGLRHRRFAGGQGVAGRAGLILRAGHDPLMSTPAYAARADASADARAHTGC